MLMLPRIEREPARDFHLLRTDTSSHKALDLGPSFAFEYNPLDTVLRDHEIREDIGSLLIVGSQLLIATMIGGTNEGELALVDVKLGTFLGSFPRSSAAEVRCWRLLLRSEFPGIEPRVLVSWP